MIISCLIVILFCSTTFLLYDFIEAETCFAILTLIKTEVTPQGDTYYTFKMDKFPNQKLVIHAKPNATCFDEGQQLVSYLRIGSYTGIRWEKKISN